MNPLNLNARNVIEWSLENVKALKGPLRVEFEDGKTITMLRNELITSYLFWEIHRRYPKLPVWETHSITSALGGKMLNMGTHKKLFKVIVKDLAKVYGFYKPEDMEPIAKLVYEITNTIYNELIQESEPDITTIDLEDFIEIVEYPPVKECNERAFDEQSSIARNYREVMDIIMKDRYFDKNSVAQAARSGLANKNQILQCVARRGKITEVDGAIMLNGVESNYTRGLYDEYEYVLESRSASKNLYYSEAPLQDAEYFARRLQLLCSVIEKIEYKDCGTTNYVAWRVKPPQFDDTGTMTYGGDLIYLQGKWFLNETTGLLEEIDGVDQDLNGKVIKMRSALHCKCKNPHHVCHICFGKISANVPAHSNIGHLCSASMTLQTTQSTLSIKHLDESSSGTPIKLSEEAIKYFHLTKNKFAYLLNPDLQDSDVKVVINSDEAMGLVDIIDAEDVCTISPIRISSIKNVHITALEQEGVSITRKVPLHQGSRSAIVTLELMMYLKENPWTIDSQGNFVLDMTHWNYDEPIFKMPDMEYSFAENSAQISNMIEGNMKEMKNKLIPGSAYRTLNNLFYLVNSKLNLNIACMEIIIKATMIRSEENYDIVTDQENPIQGIYERLIAKRSFGVAMAYEGQAALLKNPASYIPDNRPSSVMDVYLHPKEVVEEYDKNLVH